MRESNRPASGALERPTFAAVPIATVVAAADLYGGFMTR
jgi:hypothetical protein